MPETKERNRDDRGQFVAGHDATAGDVFGTMDPLEPHTTRELADTLGVPRRSVYEFLETLAEQGRIRKKKPEPRRAIWIRPPEDGEAV
jgi:DNA-binding GntR family transcriptional regulator